MLKEAIKKCIKEGKFVLTSGKISDYYIDLKKAYTDPRILKLISRRIIKTIKKENIQFDKIAGIELGSVPIAVALSLDLDKPFLIVRKEKKEHGTARKIEGDVREGDIVIIVEDVTTTGNTVAEAVRSLKNAGAEVRDVIVVVDREEGAEENLKKEDIRLIPIFKASELRNG